MADQKILPSITGNAMVDTAIRYGAATIGAGIVAWAASWAAQHGFKIPDKDTLAIYTQIASGGVVMGGAILWGLVSTKKSEATVVANAVQSAATGQVPEAIAAKATLQQLRAVNAAPNATVAPIAPAKPGAVPSV